MKERTFRVRFLWLGQDRVFAPGALRIAGGKVIDAGPARGGKIAPLALVPGLVNAHAHLQLPALARPKRQFLPWVQAVMAARVGSDAEQQLAVAAVALRALLRDGVTSVGEIDSSGLSPAALADSGMAGVCYQELLGFDLGRRAARAAVVERWLPGTRHCRAGLSPHAPYSVSGSLLRAAAARRVPMAIHVAETEAELEFLQSGTGPFRDLLEGLGKLPDGHAAPGLSPVRWLQRCGVLGPRTSLIHAQHLGVGDAQRIARAGSPVVVCPGTIRYFRRCPPALPEWLELGIPVGLGTDSLASNTGLSIRAEMAEARRMWPQLAPQRVLAMATHDGHRALGRLSPGGLRRNGPASFLLLPCAGALDDCLEAFTTAELVPAQVWLRGLPIT